MMITSFTGANVEVLIWICAGAALVPVLYSFILYRKLEGLGPDTEDS